MEGERKGYVDIEREREREREKNGTGKEIPAGHQESFSYS